MAKKHSSVGEKCPLEEKTFERLNPISGVIETLPSLVSTWSGPSQIHTMYLHCPIGTCLDC